MTVDEYRRKKRSAAAHAQYEQRKAEHRCKDCGKVDADTLSGRVRCSICSGKLNDYARQKNHDFSEKRRESNSRYREKRIAMHRCVRCGGSDTYTENGRHYCFECLEQCRIEQYTKKHPGQPVPGRRW